ncbi:hypothetical protein H4Q26_007646 [Puccinia striiformis f. sp. tritici PST-130]|nr:hypothetical protein H4Q26_007646 [Puccinia striiformis f. sp. tritici PST-130]
MDEESKQPLISSSEPSIQPSQTPMSSSETPSTSASATTQPSNHLAKEVKVWLPSANAQPAPRPPLGDEYFIPTAAEAQRAFSGQVANREKLTDSPMLTKTLRERELNQKKNQKLARFPITRIRIKFGDRSMLEGSFPSTSKISDVYKFVKESLSEDVRTKPFILYQTPPRREFLLKDQKTASIYNHSSKPPPLTSELWRTAQPLPAPPSLEPESGSKQTDSALEKGKHKIDELLKSGAKAPKWLQNLIASREDTIFYPLIMPLLCIIKLSNLINAVLYLV